MPGKMTEQKSGRVKAGFILLLAVGLLIAPIFEATATHLRAGEITVERISCVSRTFRITITVYTDTDSPVQFGGTQDILDFGDGKSMLVPEKPSILYPGGVGIGIASFSVLHTYGGPGLFTISYLEPNRNEGVLNIDNSVNTTFYIETQIDLSVLLCDNSPVLLVPPIDQACSGVAFYHNPGAYDPDGDSLSFELVIPYFKRDSNVAGYRDPNNSSFYTNFPQGNENGNGPPTFTIDPIDGTIIWDAPGKAGEYNIAFIIKEWRNINGAWREIGFVRRDMQIIVSGACTNERPKLIVPNDTCIVAGTILDKRIFGIDPENHIVKIEAFSEIFANTFPSRATVSPNPPIFQSSSPTAELDFNWVTNCEHVKDQAYLVVFKITDDPPLGPSLVTFETWRINVIAPAPILQPVTVDLLQRHARLDWDAYDCFREAEKMQVWRKVDDTNFTPDDCFTGMPKFLGFSLIAEIPIKNGQGASATPVTTYTDTNGGKGLAVGAKYCYRLVAMFPLPLGGESYVSDEVCIAPILADAPVITHVTVDKTGDADGEVTIRWTPPFEIDPGQYPGPYEYMVKRISGAGFTYISPKITDTTWTDTGVDTRDEQYSYQIRLYSSAFVPPVDSSSIASSLWLELNPQKGKIELNWSAVVPWSNQLEDYPMHRIYRGDEGATEAEMVLIDSVNVIEEGFTYLDTGKLADGDTLNGSKIYCYRIMARGSYGNTNPAIPNPLINFSQINCAQPTDSVPPCKPIIAAFVDTCENFFDNYGCNPGNYYTNVIKWNAPAGTCADDVRFYNVYASDNLIATNVRDTFYLHTNLSTLAYCYRIAAVDRSNNESTLSDPVCNDNCPYYELPNVFSPGNTDGRKCNDLFRAFGAPLVANSECPPSDIDGERCARFVQKVDFTVYNRWGKKVYQYVGQQGDDNNGIYINWDGRDEQGRELASAVYYYIAVVTFDRRNSGDRVEIKKGWVHLVR